MLNLVHTVPRLLIIDDDSLLRGMAAHTLRHAGFEVMEAEDGIHGLALIEKSTFDLLLLDVMMPHLVSRPSNSSAQPGEFFKD